MRRLLSPTYVSSGNYSTQITPSVPIDQLGYRIPSSYCKAAFVDDMTKTLRKMSFKEHHFFTIRTPPLPLHAPFGAGKRMKQAEKNKANIMKETISSSQRMPYAYCNRSCLHP